MDTTISLPSANSTHASYGVTPTLANCKVFRNQDLLGLIFSNLVEYKSKSELTSQCLPRAGLEDLFQVGLTCKAFVEPVLNLLWYEMDSLLPLLHLIAKVTKEAGVYTSSSIILPADLQTFESYACRIRHIHLSSFKEKVSNHIYSAITQYLSNKNLCLFPALRCFAIHSFDGILEENLVILPLIASSSSLSTIAILNITGAIEIHLASFLYGVGNLHSSRSTINPLSSLYLNGPITMSTIAQLDNFKRLSTLELTITGTNFPLGILSSLSKLPSLTWLVLWMASTVKLTGNPMVYSLANLRTISVSGNAVAILGILRSIYGEQLRRVKLGLIFPEPGATDAINACVKHYQEMAPHVRFYTMLLNTTSFPPNMFVSLPRKLRSLHITSGGISMENFCDLFDRARADSWSVLESLTLRVLGSLADYPWRGIDQVVSLSSLSMLAESCPRLHTLELYLYYPLGQGGIDNEVLEIFIESSIPTNHKLTNLKIEFLDPFSWKARRGDIMDAVTISRFIDHVFPNVQNVDMSDRFGDVRKEWYSGIKAMMKNYRDVRERKAAKEVHVIPN